MIKIAQTKYGKLESVLSNRGFALFRGIPYAKPPIGELRFRAPQDPDCWEGIRHCDTYGPACCQFDRWKDAIDDITDDSGHPYIQIENYPYPPKMSEDCLYLNIYTPAESKEDRLPVLFYIHGGGCQQWYGSDYEYCGDRLCEEGCIVVSITYRLNVFGFFAHPDLAKEAPYYTSGNYGLMDQIQALKWVYENIEAFGGDKDRITVFGQSAGGGSSLSLLCSPYAEKYIARVSLQSCGGIGFSFTSQTRKETEEKGLELMKYLGVSTIEELRQLNWEVLRDANDKLFGMARGFNMQVDGVVLPYSTNQIIMEGKNKDVDIIIGCTADEGANQKPPFFGFNMNSSVLAFAKAIERNGKKPVYSYVFDREQPGDDAGIPHSCDNRYQFGTLDGSWRPYTEEDWELSAKMRKYWTNFAKMGNPNGEDLPLWTPYTKESKLQMQLKIGSCEMHDFDAIKDQAMDKESEEILNSYHKEP